MRDGRQCQRGGRREIMIKRGDVTVVGQAASAAGTEAAVTEEEAAWAGMMMERR